MKQKLSQLKPGLLEWLKDHDERWSFIILYVGAAILLSLYAGLFWVVMLMLVHLLIELARHAHMDFPVPFLHALWHTKLDIGLIFFALVIVVYSDSVMAALGLGQSARAAQASRGLQMASRFGVIESAFRTFLLTADDLFRISRVAWKTHKKNRGVKKPVSKHEEEPDHAPYPWKSCKLGDYVSLTFGGFCFVLLLLSPVLTGKPLSELLKHLASELSPF